MTPAQILDLIRRAGAFLMIRLARLSYNFVAEYHNERALDHARRRDRALRDLERLERRQRRRQVQREIEEILARKSKARTAEERALAERLEQAFRIHNERRRLRATYGNFPAPAGVNIERNLLARAQAPFSDTH